MNIVITGAGGVLCSAFSRALAADGHKIALLDLNLEAAEREAEGIRKAGGDGHAALSYISDDIFDEIKDNELIDRISYTKSVSYRLHNAGLEKWRAEMWYMDDTALEFGRYEPTTGRTPEAENEIMVDTETLKALGVPAELGATVPLELSLIHI